MIFAAQKKVSGSFWLSEAITCILMLIIRIVCAVSLGRGSLDKWLRQTGLATAIATPARSSLQVSCPQDCSMHARAVIPIICSQIMNAPPPPLQHVSLVQMMGHVCQRPCHVWQWPTFQELQTQDGCRSTETSSSADPSTQGNVLHADDL